MQLFDVYELDRKKVLEFLYQMLAERNPIINISHKKMPSFEQHTAFFDSKPYAVWYIINDDYSAVGQCYLTIDYEIGIQICVEHQGKGHGPNALVALMNKHGRNNRYLANIAPDNTRSIAMFEARGFRHIQNTYELDLSGFVAADGKVGI